MGNLEVGCGSEWLGPGSECVQQEMSWWDLKVNFGDSEVTGREQNVGGWYPDIGLQGPPASALTPEDPVGAAELLAPSLGFKPGAVVRCEMDKCAVRQALVLQHLQYLAHYPVHLLHIVAIAPMCAPTSEFRRCHKGSVRVQQGQEQQEGGMAMPEGGAGSGAVPA